MSGKTTTRATMHRRALAALVVVLGAVLISAAPARADQVASGRMSTSSLASRCAPVRIHAPLAYYARIPSCITGLGVLAAGLLPRQGHCYGRPDRYWRHPATSATDMSAMTGARRGRRLIQVAGERSRSSPGPRDCDSAPFASGDRLCPPFACWLQLVCLPRTELSERLKMTATLIIATKRRSRLRAM